RAPPSSPLLPYTTLFRSLNLGKVVMAGTPTPPTSRGRPDPEAARALYRRHADSYDEQTDWAGPHRARVVELLDLRPGDRVVDVGDRKSTRLNSSHQIISY